MRPACRAGIRNGMHRRTSTRTLTWLPERSLHGAFAPPAVPVFVTACIEERRHGRRRGNRGTLWVWSLHGNLPQSRVLEIPRSAGAPPAMPVFVPAFFAEPERSLHGNPAPHLVQSRVSETSSREAEFPSHAGHVQHRGAALCFH